MKHTLALSLLFLLTLVAKAQTHVTSDQVKNHIGDSVHVCGTISGAKFLENAKNAPTLLDVDGKYPDQQFTIVIFKDVRDKFSYAPDTKLIDQKVCLTGKVDEYKGKPQIILHDEKQLQKSN